MTLPAASAPAHKTLAWSLLPADWRALCEAEGQPPFRARQLWTWLYVHRVDSWEAMTNLPAAWRQRLAKRFDLQPWLATGTQRAEDGVSKLLLTCRDGQRIETVLIPSSDRQTVCLSTQAGCAFGCVFCATAHCGWQRDLEAGEIVGQWMAAARLAAPRRLTHVVVMGMGEPFANYDSTLRAVRVINDFDGLAIGARRITISSCGVVPGIARLAEEGLQVELSISLHAPDDALRSQLMPVNERWPLTELLPACAAYTERTGRIITFEYTLIGGVNDSAAQADELSARLRTFKCRVNLIPLSPVAEFAGQPPEPAVCAAFAERLARSGLNVTLRRSRGAGVAAACGQLRLARGATAAAESGRCKRSCPYAVQ